MAINRQKVREAAEKYLNKGQLERAVGEYMKIVEDDPKDVRTWLKIGDLQAKRGARPEACEAYRRVAEQYAVEGFYLKAVAVHKQILKLDPSRLDVQLELAEMHLRLNMRGEAIATLDSVARSYARDGDIARTLELLRRMGQIDPDSVPIRIRYAEALSQANRKEEAADAFGVGAAMLRQQGRLDDWAKVVERQLFHRPTDVATARELATHYLQRRDPKRALAKLQTCFAADKRNIHTLDLLAVAFEQLGQIPKTISVYKEMAKFLLESEQHEQRATVLNRILELDPSDREARQALGVYAPSTRGSIAPSAPPPVLPEQGHGQDTEQSALPSDSEFDSGVVPSQARSFPAASDGWGQVTEHTAQDAEPYAPEDSAVAYVPRNSLPPAPPGDTSGSHASASPSSRPMAPVAVVSSDEDDAEELDSDVIELEDDEDEVMLLDDDASVDDVFAEPAAAAAPAPMPAGEPAIEESSPMVEILSVPRPGSQSVVIGALTRASRPGSIPPAVAQKAQIARLLTECEVFERYGLKQKVVEQLNRVLLIDSRHVEARERLKETFLAMGQIEDAVAQLHALAEITRPTAPETADRYLSEAALLAGDPSAAAEEVLFVDDSETRAPSLPPKAPSAAPEPLIEELSSAEFDAAPLHAAPPGEESEARARSLKPPSAVEETLDEVEFFIQQQLFEEARVALNDALLDFPGNRLLTDKLEELAEVAAEAILSKPPSRPAPRAEEDESFLLAEKLALELDQAAAKDDLGSDVIDVETVFQQFKKGVEATVSKDDSATHYDLGIAYMEMGLLDDAVSEFELARTDAKLECSAYTMIGTCQLRKGAPKLAIEAFKSGLDAKQKGAAEELALRFELGQAYEEVKDTAQALAQYRTVKQKDPNFRDVERRIRALEAGGAAAVKADVPERDEIDAAFDELIAKE